MENENWSLFGYLCHNTLTTIWLNVGSYAVWDSMTRHCIVSTTLLSLIWKASHCFWGNPTLEIYIALFRKTQWKITVLVAKTLRWDFHCKDLQQVKAFLQMRLYGLLDTLKSSLFRCLFRVSHSDNLYLYITQLVTAKQRIKETKWIQLKATFTE